MDSIFRYEWLIVELIVLAFLIREYVKTRRLLRESRAAKAAKERAASPE